MCVVDLKTVSYLRVENYLNVFLINHLLLTTFIGSNLVCVTLF